MQQHMITHINLKGQHRLIAIRHETQQQTTTIYNHSSGLINSELEFKC